jgi:hypothetical protein
MILPLSNEWLHELADEKNKIQMYLSILHIGNMRTAYFLAMVLPKKWLDTPLILGVICQIY